MSFRNALSEVRVVREPLPELIEELLGSHRRLLRRLVRPIVDIVDSIGSGLVQRRCTTRAESLPTSKRRATLPAFIELGRLSSTVLVDDTVVGEDLVVHLFIGDHRISRQDATVFDERGAMFDLLLAGSLPNPVRDGSTPEQMRVNPITIDTSSVGDLGDSPGGILLSQGRSVVVAVSTLLVKEGNIVTITAGMDVEPIREMPTTPRQRSLSTRILDVGVGVDLDCDLWRVHVDVADAKGQDGPNPKARIPEDGDHRLISSSGVELRTRIQHGIEFFARDFFFGIVLVLDGCADGDITRKIGILPGEKLLDTLFVSPNCRLCESVLVFEQQFQRVDVVDGLEVGQGHFGALGTQSNPIQVANDGAQRVDISVVRAEMGNPSLDVTAIGFDELVAFFQEVTLILELFLVTLDVIDVGHRHRNECMDYSVQGSNPARATNYSDIIQCRESGLKSQHTPGIASTAGAAGQEVMV